ncbi:unnamed protein product [Amoebophrya sp. A120]|nr:unnamed protein product [Amoebophrya sp. A120]|eukprot:GSA120T00017109001.1
MTTVRRHNAVRQRRSPRQSNYSSSSFASTSSRVISTFRQHNRIFNFQISPFSVCIKLFSFLNLQLIYDLFWTIVKMDSANYDSNPAVAPAAGNFLEHKIKVAVAATNSENLAHTSWTASSYSDTPLQDLAAGQLLNVYIIAGYFTFQLVAASYLIYAGHKASNGMRFLTGMSCAGLPFLGFPEYFVNALCQCGLMYSAGIPLFFTIVFLCQCLGGLFLVLVPEQTLMLNAAGFGWMIGYLCWMPLRRLVFLCIYGSGNSQSDFSLDSLTGLTSGNVAETDRAIARQFFLMSWMDIGALVFAIAFAVAAAVRVVRTHVVIYPFLLSFTYAFAFTGALVELCVVISYFLVPFHKESMHDLTAEDVLRGFADLNTRTIVHVGFGWRTTFFWTLPSFYSGFRAPAMIVAASDGALGRANDVRRGILTEYASPANHQVLDCLIPFIFAGIMLYLAMCAALIRLADTIPKDPEEVDRVSSATALKSLNKSGVSASGYNSTVNKSSTRMKSSTRRGS